MNMYIKFTIISFAFLIANTMAFTLGLTLLSINESLFSIPGILAVSGVILANCGSVQLLVAGKYSINTLFYVGILPVVGYMLSYLLFTKTEQGFVAIMLYSISLVVGVVLLFMTIKDSQNKKSLVL
jgi:hypothetical protein